MLHIAGAETATPAPVLGPATSSSVTAERVVVDTLGRAVVEITFSAAGAPVAALQFDIGYSSQDLEFRCLQTNTSNNPGKTVYVADVRPGLKRVLVAGPNNNLINDGAIATLSIQVDPDAPAGPYPLDIGNLAASTITAAPYPYKESPVR